MFVDGTWRWTPAAPHPTRVCFLYIGQSHQVLHSLSAAVQLARSFPYLRIEVASGDPGLLQYARQLVTDLGGAPLRWRTLGPAWLRPFARPDGSLPKVPLLLAELAYLAGQDVIVAPERTTALMRLLPAGPKLVYTQHGAGDRAGPFEPRLGRFDLVFAAGAKQRDRMVDEGLVKPSRCALVGYLKFELVDRLAGRLPSLFSNDRPIVLYNPHFDRRLSSWPDWGLKVLDAFAQQSRYNLIFAPHLRLFEGRPASAVPELAAYRQNPAIHMDLGDTGAAVDMTYSRLADIYVGDASSQIYEFIREPRPCLFLNAHDAAWQGSESYRHWTCGPVLNDVSELMPHLDAAPQTQAAFLQVQRDEFRRTFDLSGPSASLRAAEAIARLAGSSRGALRTRTDTPTAVDWAPANS
jgi:hypothetical protein